MVASMSVALVPFYEMQQIEISSFDRSPESVNTKENQAHIHKYDVILLNDFSKVFLVK